MVLALALAIPSISGVCAGASLAVPAIAIGGVVLPVHARALYTRLLGGDLVTALDRRALAQRAALLMQHSPIGLPLIAREVAALARLPHLRVFETERGVEPAAIDCEADGLLRVPPIEPREDR